MEMLAQVSTYLDSFEITANRDSSVSIIGIPTGSIVSESMAQAGCKEMYALKPHTNPR